MARRTSEEKRAFDAKRLEEQRAREEAIVDAIREAPNGQATSRWIARRMGLRPSAVHQVGVSSTLGALEARGLVGRLPPRDRWSAVFWFLVSKA